MLLVALGVWAFWMFLYPAHLHLHEQLQLFEFTRQYAIDTLSKPAGLAEYVSRFLVQFFYNGNIGPIVVAIVFALLFNATTLLFRRSDKESKTGWSSLVFKYSLSLIPVLLLTAFLAGLDAKMTLPVALVLTLYAVWLTEKIRSW